MRKVFSSQRLENVEEVANLLRAEGIAVKIENGRSWKGHRRGNFSYDQRKASVVVPAVWIVNAEDQPRGRQLLRDMGLLESTREELPSFLPSARHAATTSGFWSGKRVRQGLLVLLIAGIGLITYTVRKQAPAPSVATPPTARSMAKTPPPPIPETITELAVHRVDVPTALAHLLLDEAVRNRKPRHACLEVDGKDPSPVLLQALSDIRGSQLYPASICPATGGFAIAVHDYMTDGSGSGTVQLDLDVEDSQLVDVERNGTAWRVLRRH